MRPLTGALAIGTATGLRSQLGTAVVAVTTGAGERGRPARALAGRRATVGAVTAALGELAADKSPAIPSRLTAGGIWPRFALGGFAAAALASRTSDEPHGKPHARRRKRRIALAAALGGAAAVGGAFAGAWWREVARRAGRPDWPSAVLEDGVALGLAWAACARAE